MRYAIDTQLSRLIQHTSRLPAVVIFLLGFIVQLFIMLLSALLWKEKMVVDFNFGPWYQQLLLLVVLAPLLETLIFQYAIIDFVLTRFKSPPAAMLTSAIAFGLTHVYSPQYILATFFSGLLFAFLYLVFRFKNQQPVLFVLILHAGYNLFVWLMRMFFP